MPTRLKSFELHGYKTFASRTEFIFADGITAIVGPNGSGKSNIADALRWVLGEQSYGLLRGKKTEDMIFAGSEQRSRAGMAQATIVFDNSDGWLPIDFAEVAIARRAYRDGDNEYLLNGQRVRLKDVSELLAKSGLAERTYTIIGQGLVDAALALKAEERRKLFEEAAGIGLYRSRREESLRRLETTRRNLERVHDIISELQPRLRSLERQAKKAQEYEQIKNDLRAVLREWYGYHWHRAQAELADAQVAARKQEEILGIQQQNQSDIDGKISVLRQALQNQRHTLEDKKAALAESARQLDTLNRERAVNQERVRSLINFRLDSESEMIRRQESLGVLQERFTALDLERQQITLDYADYLEREREAERALAQAQDERAAIEKQIQEKKNTLTSLIEKKSNLTARLEEKEAYTKRQKETSGNVQENIINAEQEIVKISERRTVVENQQGKARQNLEALAEEIHRVTEEHRSHEVGYRKNKELKAALEKSLTQVTAEIGALEKAEKSLSGYTEGARLLLQAMGGDESGDAVGALGHHLQVPKAYELAVSAALGEYINAVVVHKSSSIDEKIEVLKAHSARGTLLSLDNVEVPASLVIDPEKAPGGKEAVVGVAARLIGCTSDIENIVDLLLGQVIIATNRQAARSILGSGSWRKFPNLRVATLDGELFSANGMISVGASSLLLSRPRRLEELKADRSAIQSQIDEINSILGSDEKALHILAEKASSLQSDHSNAQSKYRSLESESQRIALEQDGRNKNLNWLKEQSKKLESELAREHETKVEIQNEIDKIASELVGLREVIHQLGGSLDDASIEDAQVNLSYWKTKLAVVEQVNQDIEKRSKDVLIDIEKIKRDNEAIHNRLQNISNELEQLDDDLQRIDREADMCGVIIAGLREIIEPLESDVERLEVEQNELVSVDFEARQKLRTAEHYNAQAKINLTRRQEALDSLRRRIEDDFGLVAFEYAETVSGPKPLPLSGLVEELPQVKEITPETEESILRQRAQLKRMGPVNVEAQIEYNEVLERYQFMSEQVKDLNRAEKDILEVIAELDLLMQREFRQTFDLVAQEFKHIFTRLFNGGIARLVMTDPDNITDTGIDIEARLPGRREQGLMSLSGGERSLTAVALVFALLKISPTPFCILDEVDAMLDESNVSRFRELLTELSSNTQFIVITHNRNTVQAAGVIYGVTMGKDTASQVISLKLDEVSKVYSA